MEYLFIGAKVLSLKGRYDWPLFLWRPGESLNVQGLSEPGLGGLLGVLRRTCGHVDVGTCPHQVLAATLTLSQPGGADYAHPILVSTPSFESHRRA